jgi:lysine 2,3-aminomutase
MGITPYYAALMDERDSNCPVSKQAIPTIAETHKADADMDDPLHEMRILQFLV